MRILEGRLALWSVMVASSTFLAAPALAKNQAAEIMKYFNPVPKKHYLNESQDRLIKKKAFKVTDLPLTPSVSNREQGFFVQVPVSQNKDLPAIDQLLANPSVNGASLLFSWKRLEPQEEEYSWQVLDDVLALCKKYNKTAIVRVATSGVETGALDIVACDVPDYVLNGEGGAKSLVYIGEDGFQYRMPIYWDKQYLAKLSNFVGEFAERYDKNPLIHSIGITGGGWGGGTGVLPQNIAIKDTDDKNGTPDEGAEATNEAPANPETKASPEAVATAEEKAEPKEAPPPAGKPGSRAELSKLLTKEYGMSQRQLVEHWKYVADIFPKAFPTARLNFAINPPLPNRSGENALDEIADYLVCRYGERVYVTRQDIRDDKHRFDEFRLLLKYRPDTYTGITIKPSIADEDLEKAAKVALDDGISFAEIPVTWVTEPSAAVKKYIEHVGSHMGFQLLTQKVQLPAELSAGEGLKADFQILNVGAATPKRPSRELDKDVASSYKILIELKDSSGKPVVRLLHTPGTPTTDWAAGETVTWQEELKMPVLNPGDYKAEMSIVDPDTARKIRFLDGRNAEKLQSVWSAPVGTIKILPAAAKPSSKSSVVDTSSGS